MADAGDQADANNKQSDRVPETSIEDDDTKAQAFQTTIQQHVFGGFVTLGLALGSQLGLFDQLIENKDPMTAAKLAEETGCKERYVEELMRMMVCGDIVDFTEKDGVNLYFIPSWKRQSLKGSILGCFYAPLLAAPYSKLVNCFLKSGPEGLEFEDVKPAFEMWKGGREMFFRICIQHIPGQLPSTEKSLDSGAFCLDIGCCDGEFFSQLAQKFPNSTFIGADISKKLVDAATEASKDVPNLVFQVESAHKLPEHWTGKFNIIFLVETLHDLPFPRETLRECHRVLMPGGVLSVVDINITSSLAEQRKSPMGSVSTYAFSLYHCLSTALATPGAEGMGTCVGYQNLQKAIQDEGFQDVQVKDIPDNPSCVHIVARKEIST